MIYVVSGPSGCGKSTLIKNVLSEIAGLQFSVSHTTRPKRPNEIEGQDYHFVSRETFEEMKQSGAFLEWAVVHNQYYGTSWEEIKNKEKTGDLILDIDVQGARQVKKQLEKATFIFVVPPSYPELEKRLRQRKTDSPEAIVLRLKNARQEIMESDFFDYLVINGELQKAQGELKAIILAHRCLFKERQNEFREIIKSFKLWP